MLKYFAINFYHSCLYFFQEKQSQSIEATTWVCFGDDKSGCCAISNVVYFKNCLFLMLVGGHNPVVTANNVWDLSWENIKSIPFLLFTHLDFSLGNTKKYIYIFFLKVLSACV